MFRWNMFGNMQQFTHTEKVLYVLIFIVPMLYWAYKIDIAKHRKPGNGLLVTLLIAIASVFLIILGMLLYFKIMHY